MGKMGFNKSLTKIVFTHKSEANFKILSQGMHPYPKNNYYKYSAPKKNRKETINFSNTYLM